MTLQRVVIREARIQRTETTAPRVVGLSLCLPPFPPFMHRIRQAYRQVLAALLYKSVNSVWCGGMRDVMRPISCVWWLVHLDACGGSCVNGASKWL